MTYPTGTKGAVLANPKALPMAFYLILQRICAKSGKGWFSCTGGLAAY